VTGNCENLDIDLPPRLVLGGRIHPKVVWDYLLKVKALPSKQLSIVRFHAASDDDRVGYVSMLSYFSSRKRCMFFSVAMTTLNAATKLCDVASGALLLSCGTSVT